MSRVYRARRSDKAAQTRDRIRSAVRELLAEGAFHDATIEEVADRAGVSRATLYQHFRSRVELVDAMCETFDANPALLALRDVVETGEPGVALGETIANCVRFWSSEDAILSQLYGVAAIDPAARALVDRQRADRRGEMERLARRIVASDRGRKGVTAKGALALLLVLTSYETFRELRLAGLDDTAVTKTLLESARSLLIA